MNTKTQEELIHILNKMKHQSMNTSELHLLKNEELLKLSKLGEYIIKQYLFIVKRVKNHNPNTYEMDAVNTFIAYFNALVREIESRHLIVSDKYLSVPATRVKFRGKEDILSTVNKHKRRKEIKFPSIQEMKKGFKF